MAATSGASDSSPEVTAGLPRLSAGKKIVFALSMVVLPFLGLELLLGICGIQPLADTEDPFVGFASNIPLFVKQRAAGRPDMLATAPNKLKFFNYQEFPARKAPGTRRIFCVGGSTTYGRPYSDTTSFCGWLREFLPAAAPTHQWEVINAGGISYASYRVALLMQELVQYEPDLFIVYSGHNEFLERRTYQPILQRSPVFNAFEALLSRTRTFSLAGSLLRPGRRSATGESERPILPGEVDAILEHTIGPTSYTRDDLLKEQVLQHYRYNLFRMVDTARRAGAEIVFITPASNEGDCLPFKSEHVEGLSDSDRHEWLDLVRRARGLRRDGQPDDALALLEQAEAIDNRHANMLYLKGELLGELDRYPEARTAFRLARDEDICPLRALTSMLGVVADVAEVRRVPLVDYAALIEERSSHAIPGGAYFIDHVHPTIEGQRMLALALMDELIDRGFVQSVPSWNDRTILAITKRVQDRIDHKTHAAALRSVARILSWAGKPEEARKLAIRALETLPGDVQALFLVGAYSQATGRIDEAARYLRRALQIKPNHPKAHNNLGIVLAQQGQTEQAFKHFSEAVRLAPDNAGALGNLGRALYARGNIAAAIEHYVRALRILPENASAHHNLGVALMAQGDIDEAELHFAEVLRIDPQHAHEWEKVRRIESTRPKPSRKRENP